jgi:hypothetical protein
MCEKLKRTVQYFFQYINSKCKNNFFPFIMMPTLQPAAQVKAIYSTIAASRRSSPESAATVAAAATAAPQKLVIACQTERIGRIGKKVRVDG